MTKYMHKVHHVDIDGSSDWRSPVRGQTKGSGGDRPRFYSVSQVAALLGMSAMTIYRAIEAGEFPAVKVRGRWIVPAKAVDAMEDAALAERGAVDAGDFVPGVA